MSAPKIITSYVHPPIPSRNFDWCAYYDGMEEGACGYGKTEDEAVADLVNNYEEPS